MKSRVYLNSAFLLRAAIGFSRHLTSAGEDSYSFNLYSIVCRISCTYFHLIRGFRFFSQKTSASMSLLLPVSSKNEGNLEACAPSTVRCAVRDGRLQYILVGRRNLILPPVVQSENS